MSDLDPDEILTRKELVTDDELTSTAEELVSVARAKAKSEAHTVTPAGPNVMPSYHPPTDSQLDAIDQGLAWIEPQFEEYLKPHPDDFQRLVDAMEAIEGNLMGTPEPDEKIRFRNEELDAGYEDAKRHIAEWEGDLATNLRRNYIYKLPNYTHRHGIVAAYLRHHAIVMAQIYERRRRDSLRSALQAIDAIEAIDDSGGDETDILLASIISLGTALTALGAAPAVVVGSGAIIGGTMAGAFTPDDDPVPLGADTVDGVLDNLSNALRKSDERMIADEEELTKKLRETADLLHGQMGEDADPHLRLAPLIPDIVGKSRDEIIGANGHHPLDGLAQHSDGRGNGPGDDDDGGGRGSTVSEEPPPDGYEGSWEQRKDV